MTNMRNLIDVAVDFLTERNWWQFHNPKNDTMCLFTEASELAEHFIAHEHVTDATRLGICDEISDVLFAAIVCARSSEIDIACEMGLMTGDSTLSNATTTYEQLRELAVSQRNVFDLPADLATPRQIVLSLVMVIGWLSDVFVWCTGEQSRFLVNKNRASITRYLADIFAHIILLVEVMNIDLPGEYRRKMQLDAEKYPSDAASGEKYEEIKDKHRAAKTNLSDDI